ncbi:MAG: type II toxin-antitoxin system ParD family antitoxin [Alphaproteobacteria bacterium]
MGGRNFSLTRHLSEFINRQVTTGRHQSASEVVREALRRYEDDIAAERASLAAIRAVAEEGIAAIERGEYTLVEGAVGSRALLSRLNDRAAASAGRKKVDAGKLNVG